MDKVPPGAYLHLKQLATAENTKYCGLIQLIPHVVNAENTPADPARTLMFNTRQAPLKEGGESESRTVAPDFTRISSVRTLKYSNQVGIQTFPNIFTKCFQHDIHVLEYILTAASAFCNKRTDKVRCSNHPCIHVYLQSHGDYHKTCGSRLAPSTRSFPVL